MEVVMEKVTNATRMCDYLTIDHQNRVSILAVLIGEKMNLSSARIDDIRIIGLIHDIGKVAMPAHKFLAKTSELTADEIFIVRSHPQVGFDILAYSGFSATIRQSVLQHHERINGSGYPRGLQSNQIFLEAKVIAVADVIDAMTSHRPYNGSIGMTDAIAEITKNKGKYYDEAVVNAYLDLLSEQCPKTASVQQKRTAF